MHIVFKSDKILSFIIVVSSCAWGLYWLPLRSIEEAGIVGSWSIVFVNACPLLILVPLLLFNLDQLKVYPKPIFFAGFMIGAAFTFYANGLVETSVIRATLLFYLSPIWSTIIGIIWLKERLTIARVISIIIALLGLIFLLYNFDNQENAYYYARVVANKSCRWSHQLCISYNLQMKIFYFLQSIFHYGQLLHVHHK